MSIPESFLVVVKCLTFNHHTYIVDAMNGFCMQNTNFPYLCVVIDDCSTDGEQEVIKQYVFEHFNLITNEDTDDYVLDFCQNKANENCYFAVFYLKYNHYSIKKSKIPYYLRWQEKCQYLAFCEGDDYWIDAGKLQVQVDFLDKNKEYGMCYTKVKKYVQTKKKFLKKASGDKIVNFEKTVIFNPRIYMLTVCFRKSIYDRYVEEIKPSTHGWRLGDSPLIFYFAHESKIKLFDEKVSGVYRILENSASHMKDWSSVKMFKQSMCDVQLFFAKKYNIKQTEAIYIHYYYVIDNRKECSKYDSSTLPLKYKIISICSHNAFLWAILDKFLKYKYKLFKF